MCGFLALVSHASKKHLETKRKHTSEALVPIIYRWAGGSPCPAKHKMARNPPCGLQRLGLETHVLSLSIDKPLHRLAMKLPWKRTRLAGKTNWVRCEVFCCDLLGTSCERTPVFSLASPACLASSRGFDGQVASVPGPSNRLFSKGMTLPIDRAQL